MARRSGGGGSPGRRGQDGPSYPPADRELIVVVERDARLRVTAEGVASRADADVQPIAGFLEEEGIALEPLFGVSEDRLEREAQWLSAQADAPIPDLSPYYRVRAKDERLDALAPQLMELSGIAGAYVKPAPEPAAVAQAARVTQAPRAGLHRRPRPISPLARATSRPLPGASTPSGRTPSRAAPAQGCRSSTSRAHGSSRTRTCCSTWAG